jgi:hypothetical protein
MPTLLQALTNTADPDAAFAHSTAFFRIAGRRAGLLHAIRQSAAVGSGGRNRGLRAASGIGAQSGVLDALIDPDFLARILAR